jgi:hypothetical protein
MPCLYCEESIPLLRELGGSQFCSDDHRQRYASRRELLVTAGGATPSRDLPEVRTSPARLADFSNLAIIRDAYPELRGAEVPISRYCDLMLSRSRSRQRSAMSARGAHMVPWMPGAALPGEGRESCHPILRLGRFASGATLTPFARFGRSATAALRDAGFLRSQVAFQEAPSEFLGPPQAAIEFRPASAVFGASPLGRLLSTALLPAGYLATPPAFWEIRSRLLPPPQPAIAFQPCKTVFGANPLGRLRSTALLPAGYLAAPPAFWEIRSRLLPPHQPAIAFFPTKAVIGANPLGRLRSTTLLPAGYLAAPPAFWEIRSKLLAPPQPAIAFQPSKTVFGANPLGRLGSTALAPAGLLTTPPAFPEIHSRLLAPPQWASEFQPDKTVLSVDPVGRPTSTALVHAGFLTKTPVSREACAEFLAPPQWASEFQPDKTVLSVDPVGRPTSTALVHAGFLTKTPASREACAEFQAPPQAASEFRPDKTILSVDPVGRLASTALVHAGFLTKTPASREACAEFQAPPQAASEFRTDKTVLSVDPVGSPASTALVHAGFLTTTPASREARAEFLAPPQAVEFRPGKTMRGQMERLSSTALLPAGFLMRQWATFREARSGSLARARSMIGFQPWTASVVLSACGALIAPLDFDWNSLRQELELQGVGGTPSATAPPLPADFVSVQPPAFHEGLLIPLAASQSALGFPLEPVWLAALFATADPAGYRPNCPWSAPRQTWSPARSCEHPAATRGPSFSGQLAWPQRGGVYWEFRETWSPPGVIELTPETGRSSMPSAISPWAAVLGFWRSVPPVARGVALAVPFMVPALYVAPSIGLQVPSLGWSSLTAAARARATVDLEVDFHSGLDGWTGKDGWSKTWSLDSSGSARPGSLALLRESIPLTDYHVELLGQIDSKALGFVLRAADTKNYQAVKLVVVKPGPLPTLALVRYAVIDGREGPKIQTPLTLEARSDTLYKLMVTVQDDHFTVLVNGVYANSWTEERLKSGGVGFFADKGEVSRLRWVHVIDKQDFLGWVCYQVSQWTADRRTSGVKHE